VPVFVLEVSVNSRNQSIVIYLLLFIAIIALVVYSFRQQGGSQDTIAINQVAADIKSGKVERVVEDDNKLTVIYLDGSQKNSNKEPNSTLIEQLVGLGVSTDQLSPDKLKIEVKLPGALLGFIQVLGYILPFIILAGVFWFIFRQVRAVTTPPCPLENPERACSPATILR
jgi:cell division protease FtsH